jgi:hypothetical protein
MQGPRYNLFPASAALAKFMSCDYNYKSPGDLARCKPGMLVQRGRLSGWGFERPAFAPSWSYARAQTAAEALFDRLGTRDVEKLRNVPTAAVKAASHEL